MHALVRHDVYSQKTQTNGEDIRNSRRGAGQLATEPPTYTSNKAATAERTVIAQYPARLDTSQPILFIAPDKFPFA